MIDPTDWKHGLDVLNIAVEQGDRAQVETCLNIMAKDIEEHVEELNVDKVKFYEATSINDFYTLKMRGYGDYNEIINAVLYDLSNLSQAKLDESLVEKQQIANELDKTKGELENRKLKGKAGTDKASNARKIQAQKKHDAWIKHAKKIKCDNPTLEKSRIATRIYNLYKDDPDYSGAFETIRGVVGKNI